MSSPSAARFKPFFAKCSFSQHWHCRFTVDELEFTAALQYMLYEKARLLGKHEVAKKIQQASGFKDWELHSGTIRLSEDEEKQWEASLMGIVRKANTAKNDSLKKELLATADSILVCADPRDHLLGVGLKQDDPAIRDQSKWHGQNILGKVLMEIRDELLAKGERGEPAQSPSKRWKVGDECMSPWSGDNKLAKAVIVKIDEANEACVVKYDYDGSTEPRDLSMLSPVKFDRRAQKRQSSDGGRYRNQRSRENWDDDEPSHFEAEGGEASDERFTFFWQANSPFSQWYASKFKVDGFHYNCAEQFMMHQKALTFQDHEKATEIIDAQRAVHQKELGRQVSGYDEEKWNAVCKEIVKKGNMAKFTQNHGLLNELLATAGTVLVEASPVDRKWGIGLTADDSRAKRRRTWKGENLLGQCLTEVRDEILEKIKGGSFVLPEEEIVEEAPEGYTLFWRSQSPFSQWYPARFTKENITYNCAEQYMMYQKAVYFKDLDAARRIIHETDPPKQKQIAKGVKGFNETAWNKVSQEVVKDGSREKYTQNPDLRRELFATANTVLVEASKDDTRWGIGSTKDEPISWNRRTWRGDNWLGRILTEVRDELMEKQWPHPGSLSPRSHAGISYRAFSLPQSPFHMFHPCKIVDENRTFSSAGHWLLFTRAGFARNTKLATEILNTEDAEQLTAIDKQLVLPDEQQQAWESGLRKILGKIITLKLDQNADIKRKLLETGSDYLVFAAAEPPLGTDYRRNIDDNWLGKMLMQIREKMIESTNFYGSRSRNFHQRAAPEDHWDTPPSEKVTSSSQRSVADHITQALERKTADNPNSQAGKQDSQKNAKVQNIGGSVPLESAQRSGSSTQQPPPPTETPHVQQMMSQSSTEKQEDIVFSSKESPFHLWYHAPMTVDKISYSCAGQYLVHLAAVKFGDTKYAAKILKEPDESQYTDFEQNCKNCDRYEWRDAIHYDFLEKVNFAKFRSNPTLKGLLMETKNAQIVFASKDHLLGTGCNQDDQSFKTANWRKKNLLGKSLVIVRKTLAAEAEARPEPQTVSHNDHLPAAAAASKSKDIASPTGVTSGKQHSVPEKQPAVAKGTTEKRPKGGGRKNREDLLELPKGARTTRIIVTEESADKITSDKPPKDRNTVNSDGEASEKVDDVSKVTEESQTKSNPEVQMPSEAEECPLETAASLRSEIVSQTVDAGEAVAAADISEEVPSSITGEISDADRLQTVAEQSHPAEDSLAEKSDGKERSEVSGECNAEKSEVETSSPQKQTDENVSSEVEATLAVNQESGIPCESDSRPLIPSLANSDASSPVPEGTPDTEAQGGVEKTEVAQSEATSEASSTSAVADQKSFGVEQVTASTSDGVPSQTDHEQSTEITQKETVAEPEKISGKATPDSEAVAGQQEKLMEEDKEKSCPEASSPAADRITADDAIRSPEQTSGELAPPQHEEKEATVPVTAAANGTEAETSEEEKPLDSNLPDASSEDVSTSQTSELAVSDSAAQTSVVDDAHRETPSSPDAELKLSDKSDEVTTNDEMSEKSADNVAVDKMESEANKSFVPAAEADDVACSTSQPGLPSTTSNDVSAIESNRDIGVPDVAGESEPEVNETPISTNNADADNGRDKTQNGENALGISSNTLGNSSSPGSSDAAESQKINENNGTVSGPSAESNGTCDIGSCPGTTGAVKTDPEKESVVTNENHSMSCDTGSVDLRKAGSGDGEETLDSSKPNSSDLASKQSSSSDEINS